MQISADDEIIIVDDGSIDGSVDVARLMAKKDDRIRLLHNNRKKGATGARNAGLFASIGDWVVFLDSDDEWLPGFYNSLMSVCNSDANVDVVTCHSQIIERGDDGIDCILGHLQWNPQGCILDKLLGRDIYVDMNGAVIRRGPLIGVGGLDENCPSFQEWDLHLRLATVCTYTCVPRPLVNYWQHQGQMSKNNVKSIKGLMYMMRKHRRLWKKFSTPTVWRKMCIDLASSVNELRPKSRMLRWQIYLIEPRTLIWQVSAKASALRGTCYGLAKKAWTR